MPSEQRRPLWTNNSLAAIAIPLILQCKAPAAAISCQTKAAVAMSTGVLVRWKRMSVDHGSLAVKGEAPFLHVRPGHFVIVGGDHLDQGDWWMGQVIFCEGSARHPRLPSLFQVADVDTGVIKWINADAVSDVIWSMDGWPTSAPVSSGC